MIIEVKICYRQTDRLTNSLTPFTGVCGFFLQVEFATSLLALLADHRLCECNFIIGDLSPQFRPRSGVDYIKVGRKAQIIWIAVLNVQSRD